MDSPTVPDGVLSQDAKDPGRNASASCYAARTVREACTPVRTRESTASGHYGTHPTPASYGQHDSAARS